MLAGEFKRAIPLATEALALAKEVRFEELIPNVLNSLGPARAYTGDDRGLAELQRAIEIARRQNNPELARSYNNLSAVVSARGQFVRGRELVREAKKAAERFWNAQMAQYADAQALFFAYSAGDWDEAVAAGEDLLASRTGAASYAQAYAREVRARIFLARGNGERAAAEAAHGLELPRAAKDAQVVQGLFGVTLRVECSLGRTEAARVTARELMSLLEQEKAPWGALDLAHLAAEIDLHAEANRVVTVFQNNFQLRGGREHCWTGISSARSRYSNPKDIRGRGTPIRSAEPRGSGQAGRCGRPPAARVGVLPLGRRDALRPRGGGLACGGELSRPPRGRSCSQFWQRWLERFMEDSGCNRWQSVANRLGAEAAKISHNRLS